MIKIKMSHVIHTMSGFDMSGFANIHNSEPEGRKYFKIKIAYFINSPGKFCIDPLNFSEQATNWFTTSLGSK